MLIDKPALLLQTLLASTKWEQNLAKSYRQLAEEVRTILPPEANRLQSEEAAIYLDKLIAVTVERILDHHKPYGKVRSLWYLRRLPSEIFIGALRSTSGYDRALAELLSWHQEAADESLSPEVIRFRVDDCVIGHLVRYMGHVKFLSNLHVNYRRTGKGGLLITSSALLHTKAEESIELAIRTYDRRLDAAQDLLGPKLGLGPIEPDVESLKERSSKNKQTLFLSLPCLSHHAPARFPREDGGLITIDVLVRYTFKAMSLEKMLDPLGLGANEHSPFTDGIAELCLLLMVMPALMVRAPWAMSSILQFGYFFIPRDRLGSLVEGYLPDVLPILNEAAPMTAWPETYDEWILGLKDVVPCLWPLRSGGVLREYQGNILIDTATASAALLDRVELGRLPSIGNPRADRFEIQCQRVIDASSWRSGPEIVKYRGRTLRLCGQHITDIDAIGEKSNTLILVSCKSIIYDSDYDKGEYRVVRNVQTTVDKAVADWDTILTRIRANPTGDNYDFSRFDRIIGVVCTPFPAYSSDLRTLAYVEDQLRACVSVSELKDWLVK